MNFKQKLLAFVLLAQSTFTFACPDGQYEQCVLPRPWGGCAQKVCVPNSGAIVDGVSDGLVDLNQGVIKLGNGVVNTSQSVGNSLSNVADKIDWSKIDVNALATAVFIVEFLANGAVCLASDGVSPGYSSNPGGTITCNANACACSALVLAMAVKLRSNMSPEEQEKTNQIVNDPKYDALLKNLTIVAESTKALQQMGIYKRDTVRPRPVCTRRPCPIEP
jgi:hypothetical protein